MFMNVFKAVFAHCCYSANIIEYLAKIVDQEIEMEKSVQLFCSNIYNKPPLVDISHLPNIRPSKLHTVCKIMNLKCSLDMLYL